MADLVHVRARIENRYEIDDTPIVTEPEADLPVPPLSLAFDPDLRYLLPSESIRWIDEELFRMTGVGRAKGVASYRLEVIESSRPDLVPVGLTWEWGRGDGPLRESGC